MRSWWMLSDNKKKSFAPALVLSALALFCCAAVFRNAPVTAQKINELPPPPPVPRYKPKPTPTPEPPEYEAIRVSSNLVVMPVSVTDRNGQPMLGLKVADFRIEEDGRLQQLAQLGDPEQVPLEIPILIHLSSSMTEQFPFQQQP